MLPSMKAIVTINSLYSQIAASCYIAWGDLKARYSSSVIGPFWLVLGFACFATGLAFIWSKLFAQNIKDSFPIFTVGLTVWILISSILAQAPNHFVEKRELLLSSKQSPLKITTLMLAHHTITFVHCYIFVLPLLLYFGVAFKFRTLLCLPGLILILVNLYWVSALLGYLGAKYRDMTPLVNALLQPLFFLTPIIFRGDQITHLEWLINLNPFTHYINVMREPLLNHPINIVSWIFMLVGAIVGNLFLCLFIHKKGRHLPFWVN